MQSHSISSIPYHNHLPYLSMKESRWYLSWCFCWVHLQLLTHCTSRVVAQQFQQHCQGTCGSPQVKPLRQQAPWVSCLGGIENFENYWKLITSPNILISYIMYIYIIYINIYIYIPFEMSSLNGSLLVHSSANTPSPDAVEASQRDSSLSSLIRSPRAPMRCRHATSGIMTWRLMSTPEKFSSQGKHQIEMGCGNHMETSFVIF